MDAKNEDNMEVEDEGNTYLEIMNLAKNIQFRSKPSAEGVQKLLKLFVLYIDEYIVLIPNKETEDHQILNYVESLPELETFTLYAVMRYIFELSESWQNFSLMDLINPTPKRNEVILRIIIREIHSPHSEVVIAQEIYDNIYEKKEEYEKCYQLMQIFEEEKEKRNQFLENFDVTFARLQEEKDKKAAEADEISNIDNIKELQLLERELQETRERIDKGREKGKILQQEESKLLETTVDNEKYEIDFETLNTVEENLKKLNDIEMNTRIESKIKINQRIHDILKSMSDLKVIQQENENSTQLLVEAMLTSRKELASLTELERNIKDINSQQQDVLRKIPLVEKQLHEEKENKEINSSNINQEIIKSGKTLKVNLKNFTISEKKIFLLNKNILTLNQALEISEQEVTKMESEYQEYQQRLLDCKNKIISEFINRRK